MKGKNPYEQKNKGGRPEKIIIFHRSVTLGTDLNNQELKDNLSSVPIKTELDNHKFNDKRKVVKLKLLFSLDYMIQNKNKLVNIIIVNNLYFEPIGLSIKIK